MKPSKRLYEPRDDEADWNDRIVEELDLLDSRLSALESKPAVPATEAVAREIVEAIFRDYDDRRGFGLGSLRDDDPETYYEMTDKQTHIALCTTYTTRSVTPSAPHTSPERLVANEAVGSAGAAHDLLM